MAAMVTDIVTGKPSKVLNLMYFVFGFVVASFAIPTSDLLVGDISKLPIVVILGTALGTFFFYTRPYENIIFFIVSRLPQNKVRAYRGNGDLITIKRTDVFNSPLLTEERAKMTGSFLFSISLGLLLLSDLLKTLNIYVYSALVVATVIMIAVTVLETVRFAKRRLKIVSFFHISQKLQKAFVPELKAAIKKKEWLEADIIITNGLLNESIYASAASVCPETHKLFQHGKYCPDCGKRLLTDCPACHAALVRQGMNSAPKHCIQCGVDYADYIRRFPDTKVMQSVEGFIEEPIGLPPTRLERITLALKEYF